MPLRLNNLPVCYPNHPPEVLIYKGFHILYNRIWSRKELRELAHPLHHGNRYNPNDEQREQRTARTSNFESSAVIVEYASSNNSANGNELRVSTR